MTGSLRSGEKNSRKKVKKRISRKAGYFSAGKGKENQKGFRIFHTADGGSVFTSFPLMKAGKPSRLLLRESGICTGPGMNSLRPQIMSWYGIRSLSARMSGRIRKYWSRFRRIMGTVCRKAAKDIRLHPRMWWNWMKEQDAVIFT